jgi:Tat protein translocase TatB subunit
MLNIGPLEMLLIFLIALIVVGPKKLPDLGRTIGKGLREFRKAQDEVKQSLQLDELQDIHREITDTQRGVRDALRFETPKTGATRRTGPVAAAAPDDAPDASPSADATSAAESAGPADASDAPPDLPAPVAPEPPADPPSPAPAGGDE